MNIPGLGDASARLDKLEEQMGEISGHLADVVTLLTEIRDLAEAAAPRQTGRSR